MSNLRDHIQTIDDLSTEDIEIPEWPHPEKPGGCVVLRMKAPSLARRNQLLREFAKGFDPATGTVDAQRLDWDGLSMAVIGEMVFDPDDMDFGPLFATPQDREMLLEKNGKVMGALVEKCLVFGGFKPEDGTRFETGEEELVDVGKDS